MTFSCELEGKSFFPQTINYSHFLYICSYFLNKENGIFEKCY